MPKKNLEVRLNAETIKRLIEFSGYEEEEIAKKLRIPLRRIREGKLTERQLNRLAKALKRPLASFFSEPKDIKEPEFLCILTDDILEREVERLLSDM